MFGIWDDADWRKFDETITDPNKMSYGAYYPQTQERIHAAKKGVGYVQIHKNYDFSGNGFQQSNFFKPSATLRVPKGAEQFQAFKDWYIVEASPQYRSREMKLTNMADLKKYLESQSQEYVYVRLERNPPVTKWEKFKNWARSFAKQQKDKKTKDQ